MLINIRDIYGTDFGYYSVDRENFWPEYKSILDSWAMDQDSCIYEVVPEVALCESRHDFPSGVESAIFENIVDPLDVHKLDKIAREYVSGMRTLCVYVTGLSVALVAVINACRHFNTRLVLMHYNRESGTYYHQSVMQ